MAQILTTHDLVSHIMDVFDLGSNPVDVRRAVRSAIFGYEEVGARHEWSTYDTQFTAVLNEQYNTGTISVDAAGTVTLTAGTWPSWSELGLVYIGEERSYRVHDRVSDSTIVLEQWSGDTLTDSAYVLRQDRVHIPDDVYKIYDVWQEREEWEIRIVDPRSFRDYDRPQIYTGSDPHLVTFRAVLVGGQVKTEMRVTPGATTRAELNVAYHRRPKDASVLSTRLATSVGETVTLVSPVPVSTSLVGCLVRLGDDVRGPTANEEFGLQTPSLAIFEGTVSEHMTTKTFKVPGIPDFTAKTIVITSVLDIPKMLYNAVKMYAEANMHRIGRGDIAAYRTIMLEADEQLRFAMEQDAPFVRRGSVPNVRVDKLEVTPYIVEG